MEIWFECDVAHWPRSARLEDWICRPLPGRGAGARGLLALRAGPPGPPLLEALFGRGRRVALEVAPSDEAPRVFTFELAGPGAGLMDRCQVFVDSLPAAAARLDWVRSMRGIVVGAVTLHTPQGVDEGAWLRAVTEAYAAGGGLGIRVRHSLDSVGRFVRRAVPALALSGTEVATLRTAVAAGYYERPRRCTLQDLADTLGVVKSTVHHRLARVEELALRELLETAPAAG